MLDRAAYMRVYRARRRAAGRPCRSGPPGLTYMRRAGRSIRQPDPWDYAHPASDVRAAP